MLWFPAVIAFFRCPRRNGIVFCRRERRQFSRARLSLPHRFRSSRSPSAPSEVQEMLSLFFVAIQSPRAAFRSPFPTRPRFSALTGIPHRSEFIDSISSSDPFPSETLATPIYVEPQQVQNYLPAFFVLPRNLSRISTRRVYRPSNCMSISQTFVPGVAPFPSTSYPSVVHQVRKSCSSTAPPIPLSRNMQVS